VSPEQPFVHSLGVEAVDLDELPPRPLAGDHAHARAGQAEHLREQLHERGVRPPPLGWSRHPGAPAVAVPADELAPRRAQRDGDRDPRQSSLTITCLTCV
jgi:hypothetical protein